MERTRIDDQSEVVTHMTHAGLGTMHEAILAILPCRPDVSVHVRHARMGGEGAVFDVEVRGATRAIDTVLRGFERRGFVLSGTEARL